MLSTTSEYALRALIELANLEGGRIMAGKTLSDAAAIPAGYLSKILASLGRAGIIDATRGLRGGYRLAKPARDILLIDVIEVFEGVRPGRRAFWTRTGNATRTRRARRMTGFSGRGNVI